MHVGIVILNYNGSEYLKLCLESITKASTKVQFSIGVIDNGSDPKDAEKAAKYFSIYVEQNSQMSGFFFGSKQNLGFSGGNNVVIKRFLEDKSITHICMINSDVLVTDEWLDILLQGDPDVIGPVTNATGNEQTVGIDYIAAKQSKSIALANTYAQKRYATYGTYRTETEVLYFFLTIFARRVIDTIGLLDEQFYPGSFEDLDYCLRIHNAGYHMLIARGCFVHHFGSGSFSTLEMPKRVEISNVNRRRFEEKWGIGFKDDTSKRLLSCRQDMMFFANREMSSWALDILNASIEQTETLIGNWAEAIAFYQRQQKEREKRLALGIVEDPDSIDSCQFFTEDTISGSQMLKLVVKKAIRKVAKAVKTDQIRKVVFRSKKPIELDTAHFDQVLEAIRKNRQGKGCVCIFAPIFDITNDKDGYFQRIKAIDETIFNGYLRIYLYDDGSRLNDWKVVNVDDQHIYIRFNSHNAKIRQQVFQLAQEANLIYTHSLLRFMTDSIHADMLQVFTLEGVKRIWDVHGAVPEEYQLNNGQVGSKIANEVEKFLYSHVDVILTVTEAMTEHLKQKHGETSAQIIVLPIFSADALNVKNCSVEKQSSGSPLVVYAGGLQPWQNIALMQDVMERTMQTLRYRILVPNPNQFVKSWGTRTPMQQIQVLSRPPEEMAEEYRFAHYGFVLRDDIAVNNVACPTKIIEYLQYGILPVLKSPNIGDFCALGMQYLLYDQLVQDNLPTEAERQKMAEANFLILNRLVAAHLNGTNAITSFLESRVQNYPSENQRKE